jgi:hypothetical protein
MEYISDGKSTTHGTVAVYLRADASGEPVAPPLTNNDASSLSVKPYHVQMPTICSLCYTVKYM